MKKCSRSTARSTTWSKLLAAALACWLAESRFESWGGGEVWAGVVWANTDVAQQTRKSVKRANGERNILVTFISRNYGSRNTMCNKPSESAGWPSLRAGFT